MVLAIHTLGVTTASGFVWFAFLCSALTGDWRWVLVYSAVAGPVLLLASDVLGRVVARPAELEVGIVTALLGAPLFIALARRRKLALL